MLHLFHRSDEDRALHDHPWSFISIILWRGYYEHTETVAGYPDGHAIQHRSRKWPLMILFRRAEWRHRVELIDGKKAVTLVIRFRRRREWGYHFLKGFIHNSLWWKENCE